MECANSDRDGDFDDMSDGKQGVFERSVHASDILQQHNTMYSTNGWNIQRLERVC